MSTLPLAKKLFINLFAPKEIKDLVLPDRIKKQFENGISQHELFYGHQGTGKSTLAKIIPKQFKHPYLYINAAKDGRIDILREGSELHEFCDKTPMGFDDLDYSIKVVILDEINNVSDDFFEALKGFMDMYPKVRFIATTNFLEKIPEAVSSRFHLVSFDFINSDEEELMYKKYLSRIKGIFKILNIEVEDSDLNKLCSKHFPDYRGTLQDIQTFYNTGNKKFSLELVEQQDSSFKHLYDLILEGDINKPELIHEEVMGRYHNRANEVLWDLSDNFIKYILKEKISYYVFVSHFIITIAKYINMIPNFRRDPALCMKACIYELMLIRSKK